MDDGIGKCLSEGLARHPLEFLALQANGLLVHIAVPIHLHGLFELCKDRLSRTRHATADDADALPELCDVDAWHAPLVRENLSRDVIPIWRE